MHLNFHVLNLTLFLFFTPVTRMQFHPHCTENSWNKTNNSNNNNNQKKKPKYIQKNPILVSETAVTCWSVSTLLLQTDTYTPSGSVCPSVHQSIYQSMSVCLWLSVRLPICRCLYVSVCLSLSICVSLSVSLSLSVCLFSHSLTYHTYFLSSEVVRRTGRTSVGNGRGMTLPGRDLSPMTQTRRLPTLGRTTTN